MVAGITTTLYPLSPGVALRLPTTKAQKKEERSRIKTLTKHLSFGKVSFSFGNETLSFPDTLRPSAKWFRQPASQVGNAGFESRWPRRHVRLSV